MHKNAQKAERKTQSKISCHYTWLLHDKNCCPDDAFLELKIFNCKQAQQKVNQKRKGEKRIKNIERPKIFYFCAGLSQNVAKQDAIVARKALKLTWNKRNITLSDISSVFILEELKMVEWTGLTRLPLYVRFMM